jgi:isoamylase
MRVSAGIPSPLGARFEGTGTNFALFSAHAEKVELCLFDPAGARELARIALPARTGDIWHGRLDEITPGQPYGYRVHGPYEPRDGDRFNPNKLLLDPYARQLIGRFTWSDTHFGYHRGSARADLSFDRRDNADAMPKSVVSAPTPARDGARRPGIAWEDTVIYEAHVKGLTMLREDVPPQWRGTYRGLAAPALVDHLKRLGVTCLELLPIHTFIDEPFLPARGLRNYWGYNTLNYFSADARYGTCDTLRETVARLHDAGIEVVLDVVYNHTAEGDHLGPTLSFRGIDNRSYYWLSASEPRFYENFTGCGNALNLTHPQVLAMVIASLRHWVETCDIDGFRFDLATTLARGSQGFDDDAAFFVALRRDPLLAGVKLIAEPWDSGPGGYRLGGFPPGWSEWNDRYRKSLRRYWAGESIIGEVAAGMTGSADVFDHGGRTPCASINNITVHDGFTLADLVSYARKHNEANGEGNRDGPDDNQSINCGVEGATDDPDIVALRRQLRRNLLCCLLLAQGVPLLLAGDEVGNSQRGNNNAYCQDNETGWVKWSALGQAGEDMTALIAQLCDLRRRFPQLRAREWLDGRRADGSRDVVWLTPQAKELAAADWEFLNGRFLSYLLGPVEPGAPALYITLNAAPETIAVTLPPAPAGCGWSMLINTAALEGDGTFPAGLQLDAPGHSVLVFAEAI